MEIKQPNEFEGIEDLILAPAKESGILDIEEAYRTLRIEEYRHRTRYLQYLEWLERLWKLNNPSSQ